MSDERDEIVRKCVAGEDYQIDLTDVPAFIDALRDYARTQAAEIERLRRMEARVKEYTHVGSNCEHVGGCSCSSLSSAARYILAAGKPE